MTLKTKMEYTTITARRYLKAKTRKEKTKILDEYCATTEMHRKYAIRKIRKKNFKYSHYGNRKRENIYSQEADVALIFIWQSYGYLCAERLYPFMDEAIKKLKQFGHLKISSTVELELCTMSRSTMARRIRRHRELNIGIRFSTTKPGTLLKKQIPIQTKSFDTGKAGFGELDTVAHCGDSLSGDFIYTLQFVDIHTTWTERVAMMNKNQKDTLNSIKKIRSLLPFPLLGIDSDNGSEFINKEVLHYCLKENLVFTRSRPYMKKDNAHIEQKNWPLVRKILGYDRYDTNHQLMLINKLYDNELRLFLNFFQPSLKLKSKIREGAQIKKKYEAAKTPYQRALDSKEVPDQTKMKLQQLYATMDPVLLKSSIDHQIKIISSLVR